MATYKDFLGSSSAYDELIGRLNSGDAKVVTSKPISGYVVRDEYGYPIFQSYAEEGIDRVSKALTPEELSQAQFNPQTERLELTSISTVPPHIDLGGKEISGYRQWPVEDLGGGNYRLSAMNSGEGGYAQVVIKPDATGKATVTDRNPASFQEYDAGNFFSNFAGAAEDLARSDAGKMLALAAAGGAFTPVGAAGAVGGGLTAVDAATAAEGFGGAGAVGSGGSAGLAGYTASGAAAIPSAFDAMGADMVTGAMPGVAPTAEAALSTVVAPELTAQEVTDMIAKEQAGAMSAQEIQAMIDAEAAAAATPAQVSAAKAAGMSIIDYARAGLLVNAITGDPLGLAGDQPTGGGGSTGFEQVPIPAEWKSPTYAAPSAPIDLSSIFTDQNLLAGTQWQGLPQQQNVSFNDIFASGQQQTPMGNMVDINQIVSAILGQNTASQKPA